MEKKDYQIDASGKILGRLAREVAVFLRGKDQPDFLPYLEPKNIVKVFNVEKMRFTGKKMKQKMYYRHSGYPGGLKAEKLEVLFARDPKKVLQEAVLGMLPKNRLRSRIIKNLKIFKGEIK